MFSSNSSNIKGSKRAVESVLVSKGNQALIAQNHTLTKTDGNVRNVDGEIGIYNPRTSTSLPNAATKADTPFIQFVQGTNTSQDPALATTYPFNKRPYEASEIIDTGKVLSITAQPYVTPSNSLTVVGLAAGAGVGEIVALDNEKYSLTLGFRGRRQDEYESSLHNIPVMTTEFTTPDYTALSTVGPVDSIVKNFTYLINKNSVLFGYTSPNYGGNRLVVAFAVNSAGGTGGVAITSVAGTIVPTVVVGGVTKNVTLNASMVQSFTEAVANGALLNTAKIKLVDLSTAGSTVDADQIVIMAIDETTAFEDRTPYVKVRIDVGLGESFVTTQTAKVVGAKANEGQGTFRQVNIFYKNTAGQRKYSQYRGFDDVRIDYPSSLVQDEKYSTLIIEHYDASQVSFAGTSVSPKKTILFVPTGDTTTKTALQTFILNFFGVTVVL